jgi:glycosyltransferase involved in cell wall biosynthesis
MYCAFSRIIYHCCINTLFIGCETIIVLISAPNKSRSTRKLRRIFMPKRNGHTTIKNRGFSDRSGFIGHPPMKSISIVIPALNEEQSVGKTVSSIPVEALKSMGFVVEVLVIDNASEDNTSKEAMNAGAKVIYEPKRGYGNAYLRGFAEASGDIIVMGDADGTYPMENIPDYVIGSRFQGKIQPNAMNPLHRYLGNPILTFILNALFKTNISDPHSGMRAFTREALSKMKLKTPGMEFASEMIIEATRKDLRIAEIPIEYRRRQGNTKLNSMRDGWRHLRFMLLYQPTIAFTIPGTLLFIAGIGLLILAENRFHTMILGSFLISLGFQIITLGLYSNIYAVTHRMLKPKGITKLFLKYNSLEKGMLIGFFFTLTGGLIGASILIEWINAGYGELSELRNAIISMTLTITGIQLIFSALFASVLLLDNGENGI